MSVGGDGVLAVTHFDADDDALDTAWRCVPDTALRARHGSCATRVAVCDLAATAVTLAAGGPRGATARVWTLEDETELRRVPLFPEASGKPNGAKRRARAAARTRARTGASCVSVASRVSR